MFQLENKEQRQRLDQKHVIVLDVIFAEFPDDMNSTTTLNEYSYV
jgi:hypothetical protein